MIPGVLGKFHLPSCKALLDATVDDDEPPKK